MTAATTRLPAGVWALGLVSLLMDTSSEMIHSLLPVFLVTVVGASVLSVGWIEGVAEGAASFLKLLSGAWSDRLGRRKPLAVLGYGLAALSKPLFPLADSIATVFTARMADRFGKGIRGAPRDALIVDLTPARQRGAAFGLRQSLDTVGAFGGPLLALALLPLFDGDIRSVFWVAVIPAFLCVALLVFGVREPPRTVPPAERPRLDRATLKRLPRAFWLLLAVTTPFMLARFSEAFLILRTQSVGLALTLVPLTLVVMNVAYSVTAYPAGRLSDRVPRARLLAAGCVLLVLADVCLALGDSLTWILLGVVLWGVHMGLTEGLIAALAADAAPAGLVGTAFGVLHCQRGLLLLVASVLAGALWDGAGPAATFAAGAVFGLLTLATLPFLPRKAPR